VYVCQNCRNRYRSDKAIAQKTRQFFASHGRFYRRCLVIFDWAYENTQINRPSIIVAFASGKGRTS